MYPDTFFHASQLLVLVGAALMVPGAKTLNSPDNQPCTKPTVAGMDDPWASKHGRDIQPNGNRLYIMTTRALSVSCCGQVVEWKYQASVRARVRPLTFMVWRPVMSGIDRVDRFKLIGQSSHWYMKDRSRSIIVHLSDDNDSDNDDRSIFIQRGDFLGWHTHKGDVVAYSPSAPPTEPSVTMWEMNTTSIPIGWELELSEGKTLGRFYGVQAVIEPVPAPEFFHPPNRLSVKCPLPAKSHVTSIRSKASRFGNTTFDLYGYNPWFTIDKISGEVTTQISIYGNFSHEMIVTAQNLCGSRSYLSFAVQCIDIRDRAEECHQTKPQKTNKAPVISVPSSFTLPENQPAGSRLFSIHVHDEDTTADNITVCITCTSGSGHLFHIDNNEGSVYLKENTTMNYEATAQHVFHATAFDGNSYSLPAAITLYVSDVNEAPFATQDKLVIDTVAKKKGSVLVKDIENLFCDPEGDSLDFRLSQNDSSFASVFAIDSDTGAIVLSKHFKVQKYDSPITVFLELIASDGSLDCGIGIEFRMLYENSKPIFLNLPSIVTIMEDELVVGDVVFTVIVHDEDDGDDVRLDWSMQGRRHRGDGAPLFALNTTDGDVTLLYIPPMSLGSESVTEITVTAFDGHFHSDGAILYIVVVGKNDAPKFLQKTFQVFINESEVASLVFGLNTNIVKDLDPDDVVTLSVTKGEHSTSHTNIFVSNGQIGITSGYDIDVQGNPSQLIIDLKATDSDGLTDRATLEIFIQDENDNAPLVESDGETFYIPDSVYPGLRIGQILATDLDSGSNGMLSFQVIGSTLNDTSQYFAIASSSGWLISTGQRPPMEWTSLFIAVSDHGTPSLITMATVNIITKPRNNSNVNTATDAIENGTESGVDYDDDDDEVFTQQFHLETKREFEEKPQIRNLESESKSERKAAILILIAICCILFSVIVALGYHLWKAKKLLRTFRTRPNAHHEYRFPWVPQQISVEGDLATHNASGDFLGTSVVNQNYRYEPVSQHQDPFPTCNNNPFSPFHQEGHFSDNIACQSHRKSHFNDETMKIVSLHEQDKSDVDKSLNLSAKVRHFNGNIDSDDEAQTLNIHAKSPSNLTLTQCKVECDRQSAINGLGNDFTTTDEQFTSF